MPLPPDLRAALDDLEDALAAMGSGDPAPYAVLWADQDDVTLFGAWGPIERGYGPVTRTFDWVGSRFSDGALVPRHEIIGHSGDLAYTVGFERGEVRVDGGEPVEMTIRVTHILRRLDGNWRIVHRHADFPPADQRHTSS
jgi:ketosteroid isomerase-like protein